MSPRLAAIGVATLSGFILQCLENTMTAAVIRPRKEKHENHLLIYHRNECRVVTENGRQIT